jgi:tRNA (adenine22-N1)-methyltransferase
LFVLLEENMRKRLECIAAKIPDGIGVIDVGTDHAYLPVALARRGYCGNLLASDIGEGPLAVARRHAEDASVADRIRFFCCDGLELCPPEDVDCIVIAGMGGDTICGILDRGEFCMDPRYLLILQPMTRAEVLRYWLIYNEFAIVEEDLVEDGGVLYPVLCARFGGNTRLSDAELFTGSFAMLKDHPLFPRFWEIQHRRLRKTFEALKSSGAGDEDGRLVLSAQICRELEEMMPRDNSK